MALANNIKLSIQQIISPLSVYLSHAGGLTTQWLKWFCDAGGHLTKPGLSKPHTHSNPTNLALFRRKITLYRFNQGAHTIAGGSNGREQLGWAPRASPLTLTTGTNCRSADLWGRSTMQGYFTVADVEISHNFADQPVQPTLWSRSAIQPRVLPMNCEEPIYIPCRLLSYLKC